MLTCHREKFRWFFGVVLTVVTFFALGEFVGAREPRGPASVPAAPPTEKDKSNQHGDHVGGVKSKASSNFAITFEALSEPPAAVGDKVEVNAQVEVLRDAENAEYAWILPAGVKAVSATKGTLGSVKQGEVLNVKFSGTAESVENNLIHLHVFKLVDGEPNGAMAQFSTLPQAPSIIVDGEKVKLSKGDLLNHGGQTKVMQ